MKDQQGKAAESRPVLRAQNVSRMCLVCGRENAFGLHGRFYELAADAVESAEVGETAAGETAAGDTAKGPLAGLELLGIFTTTEEHQSYPGRLHGGIASAILDETIGRAILLLHPDAWGVTAEITLRFRRPVPLVGEVRCRARITRDTSRLFEGTGEIVLDDGNVAVEARGKYVKMPIGTIADGFDASEWFTDEREPPDHVDFKG